jgi:lysophospholipase L1-like esterase
MPYLTQENISCEVVPDVIGGTYDDGKGGKILFTEGVGIVYHQIMVTYEHSDTWEGTIPTRQGNRLPKLRAKLKNKEDITFVCNGDSIFTGANSSGKLGIEPFIPGFPEAFKDEMNRRYGANVTLINTAVGGEVSNWGKINVVANVNQHNPDLVLIGFGMNDGSWNVPAYDYVDNIETMVRSIQHNCPNAEIIVAATIVANPASAQNKGQANYLEPLKEMVNRYQGVALLDMTTFSLDLLKIKTSFDLYANNINHPCDFMCRAYTANLLHLIEE